MIPDKAVAMVAEIEMQDFLLLVGNSQDASLTFWFHLKMKLLFINKTLTEVIDSHCGSARGWYITLYLV